MWRRLNREDFTRSSPLLPREGERYGPWPVRWRVYRHYEILPAPDSSGWHYIQAVGRDTHEQLECVRAYNPLVDTPYLFLEFARIVERKDPWQALRNWFQQYGLLGITAYPDTENREHWKGIVFPRHYHDDRGGTWDRIEVTWELAYQANESLILYEAVLGRDEEKLERALSLESDLEASGVERVDALINGALHQMIEYALGDLYVYAYPDITFPDDNLTIDHLTRSWGARNLLGAMGLQFYWLITSAGELSRCKYCGRIISYAPPMPGSDTDRKPRKDKEFCDSRCRQNYHYHYRIKPRHQSEDA